MLETRSRELGEWRQRLCGGCGRKWPTLEIEIVRNRPLPVGAPQTTGSVLTFPCAGAVKEWKLSENQVSEWANLFPGLDIMLCCREALAWVRAMDGRRKTAKGMPRFLVGWLSRAQDAGKPGTRNGASSHRNGASKSGDAVAATDRAIASLRAAQAATMTPEQLAEMRAEVKALAESKAVKG